MIISISLQNTTFVMLTIAVILMISMLIMIEKGHKRFLNIFFDFDFQALKDLIIFINYIFRRDKFKRFKYFFFLFLL